MERSVRIVPIVGCLREHFPQVLVLCVIALCVKEEFSSVEGPHKRFISQVNVVRLL